MELVLNELSACSVAKDILNARDRMAGFIQVCRSAFRQGVKSQLRVEESIYNLLLAPDYNIYNWIHDKEVDKESQRFIRNLATKSPLIDFIMEKDIHDRKLLSEFYFGRDKSLGLGAAFLLDSIAVSFNSDEQWDNPFVTLLMEYLDDMADSVSENVEVRHASSTEHIRIHTDWIRVQKAKDVRTGEELWDKQEELFPFLTFCDEIRGNIAELNNSQPIFKQLVKRLGRVDEFFSKWLTGGFDTDSFPYKISPESQATLEKYQEKHTFTCPDGREMVFSWHFSLTPLAWRVFFYPDEVTRKAIIGYIGPKLPNVKYD